ncbi:MAG TPA: glutathione S-transferase family protein [Desulfopila sp.]|nr:glutathione S-transferase family protein [Desulfopila sp.]
MKLIIGNKNYSSWSLRAWLLPAFHAISFEEVRISLSVSGTSAAIARYSQAGKVPVLHDGDLVVWDSLAICEYISERYLGGGGWPEDMDMRAEARACSAEMHSGFPVLRQLMPMNCRAEGRRVKMTSDVRKDIERIDALWSSLRKKYARRGPWLFGDFSIADCMFAPVVFRFATYSPQISEASKAYMDTVLSHPTLILWQQQACQEEEVIDEEEKGNAC